MKMQTSPASETRTRASALRLSKSGMTLLEVLMALAVFAIAATALVTAINGIGQAVLEARTFRNVDLGVESLMDEYSKSPLLEETKKDIKAGADGVSYQVRVSQVQDMRNKDNRPMQGFFKIEVTARWSEDQQPMEVKAETLRYAGLFQPIN
jgi:prepilin-type N-terminal cleavage/methylation domain-containing protein